MTDIAADLIFSKWTVAKYVAGSWVADQRHRRSGAATTALVPEAAANCSLDLPVLPRHRSSRR